MFPNLIKNCISTDPKGSTKHKQDKHQRNYINKLMKTGGKEKILATRERGTLPTEKET